VSSQKVTKLIIPVAGMGTRLLPATKSIPKEMLPVLDKPTIQYIIEDAVKAGIKDIILVTGPSKRAIEDHFDRNEYLEQFCLNAGKDEAARIIREVSEMANFIYVRQKGPYGTATPVLNCRHLIGDEPFAVLHGDEIFECVNGKPHLKQLMDVYDKYGEPVLTALLTDDEGTKKYGIIEGDDEGDKTIRVRKVLEKPGPDATASRISSLGGYILTPDIFALIESVPARAGRERYLADALDLLSRHRPVYAKIIDAVQHDTGNKFSWLKTNIEFGLKDPEISAKLRQYLGSLK